jgi:hypothetical protein
MFKVTVSGDYRTSGGAQGDIIDFEGVVGLMPECNEDMVLSHVQNRCLGAWIKADKRYTARFNARRTVYLDGIEKVKGHPSCNGKDIRRMSWEELQDLAISKNLLRIPLTHAVDLRAAREIAYLQYSKDVLGEPVDVKSPEYDFAKLPALIVDGEADAAAPEVKLNNEEALKEAQDVDSDFTFAELKKMAKEKGVKFSNKTSKKELSVLLFGEAGKA